MEYDKASGWGNRNRQEYENTQGRTCQAFKGEVQTLYAGVSDLQTNLEATYKGANDLVAGMNMLSPDDIEKATSGVGEISHRP